tara:strand:+ start:3039 stop:3482 length:444 start_codon:yes stop_codon:yes gene_type:complete
MNKKELKQLIKPIVKECINEVLLQEGVLSSIISEVMIGTQNAVLQEQPKRKPKTPPRRLETDDEAMNRIQERKARSQDHKRKLLDAIGTDAYGGVDLFEGTQALNSGGNPNSGAQPQGALSGYAPDDAGVNIDGLLNIAGGAWKKIK